MLVKPRNILKNIYNVLPTDGFFFHNSTISQGKMFLCTKANEGLYLKARCGMQMVSVPTIGTTQIGNPKCRSSYMAPAF